jgi:hypothetical protein
MHSESSIATIELCYKHVEKQFLKFALINLKYQIMEFANTMKDTLAIKGVKKQ